MYKLVGVVQMAYRLHIHREYVRSGLIPEWILQLRRPTAIAVLNRVEDGLVPERLRRFSPRFVASVH